MSGESLKDLSEMIWDEFDAEHPAATVVLARKALAINPQHAPTLLRLGHALSALANYEEAEMTLRNLLDCCGDARRNAVYCKLGHLFNLRGDYVTAAEWFRKSCEINPDDATGFIFLGGSLARQGKLIDAEKAHLAATKCADGCIDEAYHNLGLVLRGQGRLEESRECFAKALALDPEYVEAQQALDDVNAAISYGARPDA